MTDARMTQNMSLLRQLYAKVDDPSVHSDRLAAYFDDEFKDFDRNPASPAHLSDLAAHLSFFDELKRGFTDFSHTLHLIAPLPDDRVVVYWTFEGTHRDTFFGVPASGKRPSANGIDIYTLREQRIAEQRHVEDIAGLMAQLVAA